MEQVIKKQKSEQGKELLPLLQLAENAAYSAKNHFKSADILRVKRYIVNIVTTVSLFSIAIPYLKPFPNEVQLFAVVAAVLNLLVVSGYLSFHKEAEYMTIGDQYLGLYYDALRVFTGVDSIDQKVATYDDLEQKYRGIPRKHIGKLAFLRARWSLEHRNPQKDEIDLSWLRSEKRRLTDD